MTDIEHAAIQWSQATARRTEAQKRIAEAGECEHEEQPQYVDFGLSHEGIQPCLMKADYSGYHTSADDIEHDPEDWCEPCRQAWPWVLKRHKAGRDKARWARKLHRLVRRQHPL